jgi:hypothetical protein
MYVIQHCFICRPSDYTVSEDAGIEPGDCWDFGCTKEGRGEERKGYKKVKRKKNKQVDRRNIQSAFLLADFLGRFMWRITSLEMGIKI